MRTSNATGKILLNNIITSGMKSCSVDIMRKVKMINTMSIIAILIIMPFGLVDLIKGYYTIGIFVHVIAAVLIFNLLYLRKSGNYLFPIYCGTSIVAVYYIYALLTGGVNNTGYLWFFTFPLFALFLLGSKKGAAAALLLLMPPIVFFSIRLNSSTFSAYSMDFKIRFILSYSVVLLFAYLFETLKEKAQRTLSTINDELQHTIADLQVTEEKLRKSGEELEQKVKERTDELTNTLNRLKRELKHRKLAEDALKESEERYRGLFDRSLDFVYVHDFKGNFIDANPAVLESFGYTKEEIYSIDFATLLSEDQIPAALKDIEEIAHTGFQRELKEYRLKRKDGTYVYLEIQGSLVYRDGKPYAIQGIARDITARKQAEEAVRESEEKFRNLFNNVEVGMFITRLDGSEILDMNEKFLNIFGRTREEMQGLASVIHWADPSEREEMLRILEIEGRVPNFECKMLNKQGEVRTCLASSRLYRDEGIMEGSILDITERKQAENKITASLKEKEVLLKEVHHRVKNNLQVISSLLNLQSQHIKDKDSLEMFQESQNRVRSMALIHEKLYTSEDLSRIDIAAYIQDLTASLFSTYTVGNEIKINIDVTDIFCTITTAIPCGLIINELVTNAVKHGFPKERDGTITVSMTPSNTDSLILTVSDNGIGFPEEIDFRNTTTLGMQLITSLVEQLEGTITLGRSEGTTFTITFRGGVQYKGRDVENGKSTDTDC